jgi:hypothetical protein
MVLLQTKVCRAGRFVIEQLVNFYIGASASLLVLEARIPGAKDVPFGNFVLLKTERENSIEMHEVNPHRTAPAPALRRI